MAARPQPSLRARALRLLAQREHARGELARKLSRHCEDPAIIAALLDELEQQDLLSHERFAQSLARRRGARYGVARIRQELREHGLDEETVTEQVRDLKLTEFARARDVWRRRFGSLPADLAERARQTRFLAARGFPGEVIRRVLAGADED